MSPLAGTPDLFESNSINGFKVGFLNIQGMGEKSILLDKFCLENGFGVICICEHWCKGVELDYKILENYVLSSSFCRVHFLHGGVAIYLRDQFVANFAKLDLEYLCIEKHFESTGVVIGNLKLIIIALYRSPTGNPDIFLERFDDLMMMLGKPKWKKFKCYRR